MLLTAAAGLLGAATGALSRRSSAAPDRFPRPTDGEARTDGAQAVRMIAVPAGGNGFDPALFPQDTAFCRVR